MLIARGNLEARKESGTCPSLYSLIGERKVDGGLLKGGLACRYACCRNGARRCTCVD